MTIEYLSITGFAEHLGVASATIETYARGKKLPNPNARIGRVKGWLPQTIDEWNARRPGVRPNAENKDWHVMVHSTIVYLSVPEVAERIGVVRGAVNRYKLPLEDARISVYKGYLPQTIDEWDARRPGVRVPRDAEDWNLPPELQQRNRTQ